MNGHGLVAEGAAFDDRGVRVRWNSVGGTGRARCACGEESAVLPSASARKRWHRQHKAEVSRPGLVDVWCVCGNQWREPGVRSHHLDECSCAYPGDEEVSVPDDSVDARSGEHRYGLDSL